MEDSIVAESGYLIGDRGQIGPRFCGFCMVCSGLELGFDLIHNADRVINCLLGCPTFGCNAL